MQEAAARGWVIVLALSALHAAPALAQATVISTTTTATEVEATITATTTTTTTTVATDAPVVVVEAAFVEAPTAGAPVAPAAVAARRGPRPFLHPRAELALVGGDYDVGAWGGSATVGLDFGSGWSGGIVAGYLAGIMSRGSEVDLMVEVVRDFHPDEDLALLLSARLGTAFMLEERHHQDLPFRILAQLGIGARMRFDPRVAITLDVRAIVRVRPPDLTPAEVSVGMATTMGVLLHLD